MQRTNEEEGIYRVVLMGIENDTEKNRESFCDKISQKYSIPSPLLKRILDRCPLILKKNLLLNNAERLVKTLQSFGAIVSVEEKKESPPIFLEFQGIAPRLLALESSDLRRTHSGIWNVIGRAKNVSGASLNDIWVLIQVFNDLEDLVTYEETSVPINPVPPGVAFPFKVVFESNPFIKKVSISFKSATGCPISAVDCRKNKEWAEVEITDEDGEKSQLIDANKNPETLPAKEASDIQKFELAASEEKSQTVDENKSAEKFPAKVTSDIQKFELAASEEKSQTVDENKSPETLPPKVTSDIQKLDLVALEPESERLFSEENKGIYMEGGHQPLGDLPLSACEKISCGEELEMIEKPGELVPGMKGQPGNQAGEKLEILSEDLSGTCPASPALQSGADGHNMVKLPSREALRPAQGREVCRTAPPFRGESFTIQDGERQAIRNIGEEDLCLASEDDLESRDHILQKAHSGTLLSSGTFESFEENSSKARDDQEGREEEKKEEKECEKERGKEDLFAFPWVIEFRKSVGTFYQEHRDVFSKWFEVYQKDFGFAHSLHSVVTILAHARFNQVHQSVKALDNTKRIVGSIAKSTLRLEELSPLEGTDFFSGEDWRDLFHKAFPKLQQVANSILKKESWSAIDLERLIRVIPHMSDKNSRNSVRWIHELIPGAVKIDFSNMRLNIEEGIYRVASRLGVVDPNFDYYQGVGSLAETKMQSFAKEMFPQYPFMVEDPMIWVGKKEEDGGHCFPTQPQCQGCLFESFCPRLYLSFNPSAKGIRGR